MSTVVQHMAFMGGGFLLIFVIAELLYQRFRVRAEFTRKLVHVSCGMMCMLFPPLFESAWPVFFLGVTFTVIIVLSQRTGRLKSINAIDRLSYGSATYPLAVFVSFLFFNMLADDLSPTVQARNYAAFYLPLLILSFADPAAAICGSTWPWGIYRSGRETRTLTGSLAFFVVAAVVATFVLKYAGTSVPVEMQLLCALFIACCSTISEAYSRNGLDNLFIPCSVIAAYSLCLRLT
jgi:phytol kinase